jgi:hypothetical protein
MWIDFDGMLHCCNKKELCRQRDQVMAAQLCRECWRTSASMPPTCQTNRLKVAGMGAPARSASTTASMRLIKIVHT